MNYGDFHQQIAESPTGVYESSVILTRFQLVFDGLKGSEISQLLISTNFDVIMKKFTEKASTGEIFFYPNRIEESLWVPRNVWMVNVFDRKVNLIHFSGENTWENNVREEFGSIESSIGRGFFDGDLWIIQVDRNGIRDHADFQSNLEKSWDSLWKWRVTKLLDSLQVQKPATFHSNFPTIFKNFILIFTNFHNFPPTSSSVIDYNVEYFIIN
jgi:hypothetical protein